MSTEHSGETDAVDAVGVDRSAGVETKSAAGDASGDRCAMCGGGGHLVGVPIVYEDEFAAVCDACVDRHGLGFLLESDEVEIPEKHDSDGGAHYDTM